MKKPQLKIYDGSLDSRPTPQEPTVRMSLREIFPLLVHAHHLNSQWLQDLADDEIIVTHDVADILRTLDSMSRGKKGA